MTAEISIAIDGAERARRALGECIASGGVAVFPADGLYGLACDPLDPAAIQRIHTIKGRDEGKPSAVMYFTPLALRELLADLAEPHRLAAAALLPGPVTLVVPNPVGRYPLACRADPARLGIRLIEGPLAGMPHPIFQTSANLAGAPPPAGRDALPPEIAVAVDLVIDGGKLSGQPSTVIDLTDPDPLGNWHILRPGALPAAEIRERLSRAAPA